jgi:L-asparagine transporter-like permease
MFEGFLALLLAYLFFWYLLYISKKKQSKQSLDGYSPPAYDLRFFPSTAAPAALCLFVLLLVFLEQKTSAPAFLMGVLSSAVLVLLSNRAASPAVLTGLSVYQRGLIAD